MRPQRNAEFCALMGDAELGNGALAKMLSHGECGSVPTTARTVSRWRMGDCAPPAAVVSLLQLLAKSRTPHT